MRRERHGQRRKQHGKTPAAKFARDYRGLHNQERGCQRRDEPDAAQGIAEYSLANMKQEGDKRGLIDVTPRQMVTARDVIEFVAKIAVTIVEIDVE